MRDIDPRYITDSYKTLVLKAKLLRLQADLYQSIYDLYRDAYGHCSDFGDSEVGRLAAFLESVEFCGAPGSAFSVPIPNARSRVDHVISLLTQCGNTRWEVDTLEQTAMRAVIDRVVKSRKSCDDPCLDRLSSDYDDAGRAVRRWLALMAEPGARH